MVAASLERFPLVDAEGRVTGSASRAEVHGNPALMHPVVHCLVQNASGQLLLQLRSLKKDVQPGRWDTSVGGHVMFGERVGEAVVREIGEELSVNVSLSQLVPLHRYVMRSEIETELVHTYLLRAEGPFRVEAGEATDLRFFEKHAIEARLGTGYFTPNFEDEFRRFGQWASSTRRVTITSGLDWPL
ncbi:MAG: NUDIX domain-containing protein [Polyangiaceae bacterium]